MATIERTYDATATKKFLCKIELDEVNQKAESELTEIAKTAEVKGFRRGHVPMKTIKELYFARSYNMATDKIIRSTIENIVTENGFRLASSPAVKMNEEEKDAISFEVTFELLPEMPQDFPFEKIEVKTFEPEFSEEELAKELELVASKNKSFETKEGTAEIGDAVVIDAIGRIDGIEFPGGKLDGYTLELGSGNFIPGFEDQLVGSSAGESVIVTVTFPEDYHMKDLASKEAQFFTKVKEVRKSEAVSIDDEMAKKMSFENLDDLKKEMLGTMIQSYVNAHKEQLKDEVFEKLSKLLTFELAEGMVQKVAENIRKERDLPLDEVQSLTLEAEERLRLSFFLNHLALENKISVNQQDFTNFIVQAGRDSGLDPMAMLRFYSENREAKKKLEILLEENKIYDFIFQRISVSKEKVSKDEFDAILKPKDE